MATTDARPGFRLPWSADRSADAPTEPSDATQPSDPSATIAPDDAPGATTSEETESPAMIDAAPAATTTEAAVDADGAALVSEPRPAPAAAPSPSRKPNKFMADLTKAMQTAAESARAESIERLAADAKAHVEAIHADSATEATELRKQADDDVAAVRDWSKAEIARIREETDERITHRKERLEREIEQHAGEIESRIERVQARVAAFEQEMASFFERLLAEEDPTRFAAMAESLPEPPPFDHDEPSSLAPTPTPAGAPVAAPIVEVPAAQQEAEAVTEPVIHDEAPAETESVEHQDAPAEAVSAQAGWPAAETELTVPPPTTDGDLFSIGSDEPAASDDPRLSALGLTPDFAAAEAEAASFTGEATDDGSEELVPDLADDAIAARLAGIMPETEAGSDTSASTTLVVTGLVSVASIAGFKRHLSRVTGVKNVGVSSGPEGEFIYLVSHEAGVSLRDAVPALSGFAARITDDADGTLTVVAQDPESGS